MVKEVNPVQSENEYEPIDSSEFGKVNVVILDKPMKADPPIDLIPGSKVIDVSFD